MSTALRVVTSAELAQHKSRTSCWLAVDGWVFDVTAFLDEHPGGADFLLENAGRDATALFRGAEIHQHSDSASELLERYRVGTLEGAHAEKQRLSAAASYASFSASSSSSSSASATSSQNAGARRKALVDFSRPVTPQVLKMRGDLYQDWVHHTQGKTGFRLFEMSFFEAFSAYPWWYMFFLWTPVVLYELWRGFSEGVPLWAFPFLAFSGLLIWTLIEYSLHRWFFHMYTSGAVGNFVHFFAHGIHHLTPMDPNRLAFPPPFAAFAAALFWVAVRLLGGGPLHVMFAGGGAAFVLYDTMHYYFHHDSIGYFKWAPAYFRWMKTRHMDHHFKNENANYGVTSPLWDWVFHTDASSSAS